MKPLLLEMCKKGQLGKISAWHKMRDDMHARETGSKTVIKIHKGPAM